MGFSWMLRVCECSACGQVFSADLGVRSRMSFFPVGNITMHLSPILSAQETWPEAPRIGGLPGAEVSRRLSPVFSHTFPLRNSPTSGLQFFEHDFSSLSLPALGCRSCTGLAGPVVSAWCSHPWPLLLRFVHAALSPGKGPKLVQRNSLTVE